MLNQILNRENRVSEILDALKGSFPDGIGWKLPDLVGMEWRTGKIVGVTSNAKAFSFGLRVFRPETERFVCTSVYDMRKEIDPKTILADLEIDWPNPNFTEGEAPDENYFLLKALQKRATMDLNWATAEEKRIQNALNLESTPTAYDSAHQKTRSVKAPTITAELFGFEPDVETHISYETNEEGWATAREDAKKARKQKEWVDYYCRLRELSWFLSEQYEGEEIVIGRTTYKVLKMQMEDCPLTINYRVHEVSTRISA